MFKMFKKMDNLGYQGEVMEKGTELEVVKLKGKLIAVSTSNGSASTSQGTSQGTNTTCESEVCRTARQRRSVASGNEQEGPWNRKKTMFLIALLVLMFLWIVVYATLSEMKKL